jgi:hypothetical protein
VKAARWRHARTAVSSDGRHVAYLTRDIGFSLCLQFAPRPDVKEIRLQPRVIGPSGLTVGRSIQPLDPEGIHAGPRP